MLKAQNIHFGYGQRPILKGVDFSVAPGSITCLIGPSGAGKTTLLRCLALMETPQAGSLQIDEDVYGWPLSEGDAFVPPYPKLTTVFQQLFLWPHLTLRENIMLPIRLQKKYDQAERRARLEALVEAFEMQDFIERYPNEASLGQRQRVALARAVMLQPRYLLLDEITSSLDVEQIAKILDYLKKLREEGLGIFLITHLLGFARHAADQVAFLSDGRITESGGAEILKDPKTERLYNFLSVLEAAR